MSDISVSMLTPLTAETFAFRLVCSACSVVRLLVVVALCSAWEETRLVAKSDSEPPAALNGAVRLPTAPRPLMFSGGLGDPALHLGAERVVDDVGDQRGEACRSTGRIGREGGGAGGLPAMALVPSRTRDGSAVTAGLTWIVPA